MATVHDMTIVEAITFGATAGAITAGAVVWYMLHRLISGHEKKFTSKDECQAMQKLYAERNENVKRLFERLDKKIDGSIEANERQHELILEVLRSRYDHQ